MYYCPKCGVLLQKIGRDPAVLCGSITYYQCTGCKTCFKQDQAGIVGKPFNLEEVSQEEAERYRKEATKERERK